MKSVHAFARQHAIECDSWEGDTVDVVYHKGQWNKAHQAVTEMRRVLGTADPAAQYRFCDSSQAENEFLCPGAVGALTYEAGSLNAYKYVTGVLRLALERGLNLQTETPALKVSKPATDQQPYVVETPRGKLEAKKVVFATNGYTAYLYPKLQGVVVPLRGQ